jgi:hypothetical protein
LRQYCGGQQAATAKRIKKAAVVPYANHATCHMLRPSPVPVLLLLLLLLLLLRLRLLRATGYGTRRVPCRGIFAGRGARGWWWVFPCALLQ